VKAVFDQILSEFERQGDDRSVGCKSRMNAAIARSIAN